MSKTGTLTADTQSLSKLVLPLSTSRISEDFQHFLLAGCHSLVQFHDGDKGRTSLIGDTLDKAAFLFSGWKYDVVDGSFALPHGCQTSLASTSPVRLWQISNFPFDPSRRLSSSIVVVQLKNSCLELWRLMKGSPEAVQTLYQREEDNDFVFEDQTKQLEAKGFRSISLGGENLTHDSICQQLFPKGLSVNPEILNLARSKSESLHRSNIENRPLINCGFACFHAAIRSSSRRVINELNGSHIDCIMLTGDSMDAALSVATKIDLIKPKKLVVLELSHNSSPSEKRLVWRKIKCRIDHEGVLNETQKLKPVTVASVRKFLSCRDKGSYSIAASGPALEHVLNNPLTNIHKLILRNVGSISIIARATPELKKEVIDCLRSLCGRRVMMCGE
jgi:magnesium-transporting ATPase (P-type)